MFKKTILGVLILLVALAVIGYVYLFVDNPFPEIQTSGLVRTDSKDLHEGKANTLPGDSITKNITTRGPWFVDRTGRTMILHGINVSGSSKIPFTPRLASHLKENFYASAYTVSFTGRPFPLLEADEHFERLHQWGYRFLRLLVTWEAIEHAGPGKYDEEYLNYIQALVKKAGQHELNVFIDPHQDVWSRFTGGDGAPYWTLEKVGFDPTKFPETGAALVHNVAGDPFPRMIWPTNLTKLGTATMFTLFFGGNDFAPAVRIDSSSAQDYLQRHYIEAVKQVALKLKGMPNVIGFDTFNEPAIGYISYSNLDSLGPLKNGVMPTPFQGMVAGGGNTIEVGTYEFAITGPKELNKVQLNPSKISAWKDPSLDIWKNAGVWGNDDQGKPVLLKPDYFTVRNGGKVNFAETYFKPFVLKFSQAIHEIDSTWLIFAEPATFRELPEFSASQSERMVNAPHSYDVVALMMKSYSAWFGVSVLKSKPVFGKRTIRETFHDHNAHLKEQTKRSLGNHPTLLGEFGSPFDLNEKSSYTTQDFSEQEAILDRSFHALESNQLSYTLWTYTPDNDNDHGDQWNGEDLSIFSQSQRQSHPDINSGGRGLAAAIRPYPYKVSGEPIEYSFNKEKKEFYLTFNADPDIKEPTEIFLPDFHYGDGFEIYTSPGTVTFDKGQSLLLFTPKRDGEQTILVRAKK